MQLTKRMRVFAILALVGLLMIFTYIDISSERTGGKGIYGLFEPYHAELMLFLAILGITTGAIIYAFMETKIEKTKDQDHISTSLFLKLLESNQRKITKYLWGNNGKANQLELSHIEGLDKLKVHRTLKALQEKNVITIEHFGKINKILLQKDILVVGKNKS